MPFFEKVKYIAISNMVKCNTTGEDGEPQDKTPKEVCNTCIKDCGVIQKEIEVLKPKRIIYMTHKKYDEYIDSFNYGLTKWFEEKDRTISNKGENQIWSKETYFANSDFSELMFVLRMSHPERKRSDNFIMNILSWIEKTKQIESNVKMR